MLEAFALIHPLNLLIVSGLMVGPGSTQESKLLHIFNILI